MIFDARENYFTQNVPGWMWTEQIQSKIWGGGGGMNLLGLVKHAKLPKLWQISVLVIKIGFFS